MAEAGLRDQSVRALLDAMASRPADPAAGSAAALAAAMGAALLGKTARLSRRHLDDGDRLVEQAEELRTRALALAEDDASTVAAMAAEVRPASDDAAGDEAPSTVADAIAVPRRIEELATETSRLADRLAQHGNPRLRADAHAARHLADAAAAVARAIVRSNEGLLR